MTEIAYDYSLPVDKVRLTWESK